MTARSRIEAWELQMLSPYACKSAQSRGRERPISDCAIRTEFQRDRDRILHSKSFRRLMHKTQMFLAPEGDHYRTRLVHTMEVSQIARTIARALRLNEDLTEAIAMGHDVGHTPFGHTGERALNQKSQKGFRHNEQSLRVVEQLENGCGLNLTWEVRDGILNHSGEGMPATLEGQIVRLADRIAYINHDIDDAIRGGLLRRQELPAQVLLVLGTTHGERIDTMVADVIAQSEDRPVIAMSTDIGGAMNELRDFMFSHVYKYSINMQDEQRAHHLVSHLYGHYIECPQDMGERYAEAVKKYGIEQAVCDHIAGMTDRHAIGQYRKIFLPSVWQS